MNPTILYSVANSVATITLNRPEVRNALNLAMCEELFAAAKRALTDEAVRLVLVRGAGPVFCGGADRKEREGIDAEKLRARRLKAFDAYGALEALPMPTVAVVHGPAVGSGVEIAAACDFIVATPEASFRTPEAQLGTIGATQRLPRVLGKRLAKDLMFTGRVLGAEEAHAHGLVTKLVPAAELEKTLDEMASVIAAAPPEAMRLAKRTIDRGFEPDARSALETEIAAIEEQIASGAWMGRR